MAGKKKTALEKEIELLQKKEEKFIEKSLTRKESLLNQTLAHKVPEKLKLTLHAAFSKAFHLMFEKGTGVIDKTYPKEQADFQYKVSNYAAGLKENRKNLRVFARRASASAQVNLLLSGVEGVGLGLLGIGLPDIPIFAGMILKSLYETAAHYGYNCHTEEEKYFILKLIQGALCGSEELKLVNTQIDEYIAIGKLPSNYDKEEQIRSTSETLSGELLYMKFLQGIPIAGVIGGAYDAIYLKKIVDYGGIKYRKRFLLDKQKP